MLSIVPSLKCDALLSPTSEKGCFMAKPVELSFDQMNAAIAYDPETGSMTWRIDVARNVKAGTPVGSVKMIRKDKAGVPVRYRYIRYLEAEIPASRVAWLLHTGAWPTRNIMFKDGDSLNLRFDNLAYGKFSAEIKVDGARRSYRMSKEAQRHYGLKRYYGLSGEQYGAMVADQKGLCGVCGQPETAMVNGTMKVLHVDHCHGTGRIRELLCGSCNGMLGLAKDSPETLRAAADYIEKHRKLAENVVPLSERKN